MDASKTQPLMGGAQVANGGPDVQVLWTIVDSVEEREGKACM